MDFYVGCLPSIFSDASWGASPCSQLCRRSRCRSGRRRGSDLYPPGCNRFPLPDARCLLLSVVRWRASLPLAGSLDARRLLSNVRRSAALPLVGPLDESRLPWKIRRSGSLPLAPPLDACHLLSDVRRSAALPLVGPLDAKRLLSDIRRSASLPLAFLAECFRLSLVYCLVCLPAARCGPDLICR